MNRSLSFRSSNRRKGQALLLAILVMIFAALIGITFITVVAVNIGQTGREEERGKAYQAAQAGLAFANLQITNGIEGLRWRPEQEVKFGTGATDYGPPDSSNVFYWTPFDNAQGWASPTTGQPEGNFVKFPDPRSTNPTNDAPNYMVKVEKVTVGDSDNTAGDKTGALRITSIGLSPDDPTSFYKTVAYKNGPAQSPFTGAMRSVTNWNFQDDGVPTAQASSTGSGTSLGIAGVSAAFPAKNFYITIGNGTVGSTLQSVFVTAATPTTLTLASSATWNKDDHIEIASVLGAPLAVDYNKDGTADTTTEKVNLEISAGSAAPGSSRVNGSLIVSGNTIFDTLRDPQATPTATPGQVSASGLVDVVDAGAAKVSGTYKDGATVSSQNLVSSTDLNFPFVNDVRALGIVSDARNRINNSPDPTRQVKPFTPPDLTRGGSGFGRYRQLTKYSEPLVATDPPQAAAYGYGNGIYVNNPQDRERKRTGTAGSYTDMTQDDLTDLWYRSDSDASNRALRNSDPYSKNSTTATLEEMHFRGWVSPNEFVPRGAQIILDPVNKKIHITLENRNDGQAVVTTDGDRAYAGPVPAQGWHEPDGTLEGKSGDGGVYYKTLDWPANGVIMAEGNVRIRGGAFNSSGVADTTVDPLKSITIVSMSNIYIEGSLNAGARKVILLAKKNVIVNPGAVISPADAKTWLNGASSATSNVITVHDAGAFHPGEFITVGAGNLRRQILSVDETAKTLTLDQPPTVRPDGDPVQLISDPLRNDTYAYHLYATRLSRFSDALQRRIYLPDTPTEMRLAFLHGAERREALEITTAHGAVPPPVLSSATMVNKLAANGADRETTIIQPSLTPALNDKRLNVEYDDGTPGSDDFATSPPADETAALLYRLGLIPPTGSNDNLTDDLNSRATARNWNYVATVLNNYNANSSGIIPPAHFLAAVGNRADMDPATAPGTYPMRKNIFVGESYKIPVATSVALLLNGTQATLQSDRYNTTLSDYEKVNQFGFNPSFFGSTPTSSVDNWEDVLTADQSFYQNGTGADTDASYDNTDYTLDSRVMTSGFSNGWNTLGLELDQAAAKYFDATTPPTPNPHVPYYRLSRLKLENPGQLNAQYEFEKLDPGYKLDIRAYVYAQEGSWNILPGGYFDEHIKTDATGVFVDLPDSSGSYNGTRDPGESADLNGDGRISRAEQVAAYRFLRYNYQVDFTGAIMEQKTALVNDPDGAGPLTGQVSDWTDKWATVKITDADFSGPTKTDNFVPGNVNTTNGNFATIRYQFDPDAANNPSAVFDTDSGWHPPISPELIYQTG